MDDPSSRVEYELSAGTHIPEPIDLNDPLGHDLSQVRVFSHPDTIFVGSDIVWIGAFDRETGAEVSVERFN